MISCRLVSEVVSEYYQVPVVQMLSDGRDATKIKARHVAMWLAHDAGKGPSEVGRAMGRDHTTVLHAIKRIEARRDEDPALARELRELEATLRLTAITVARLGSDALDDVDAEAAAMRIVYQPLFELNVSVDDLRAMARYIVAVAERRKEAEAKEAVAKTPVDERYLLPKIKIDIAVMEAARAVATAQSALDAAMWTDAEVTARARRDRVVATLTQLMEKDQKHDR